MIDNKIFHASTLYAFCPDILCNVHPSFYALAFKVFPYVLSIVFRCHPALLRILWDVVESNHRLRVSAHATTAPTSPVPTVAA